MQQSLDTVKEQFATHIEESNTKILSLEQLLKQNIDSLGHKIEALAQQNINFDNGLKNCFGQINEARHHIGKTHAIVVQNLRPMIMSTQEANGNNERANATVDYAKNNENATVLESYPTTSAPPDPNDPMLSNFAVIKTLASISNIVNGDAPTKRHGEEIENSEIPKIKNKKKKPRVNSPTLFTAKEDEILLQTVNEIQDSWHEVSDRVKPHDPAKCKQRWLAIKPNNIDETPHRKDSTRWQKLEDQRIIESKQRVDQEQFDGIIYDSLTAYWSRVALGVPGRTAAQCQARYN